MLRNRTEIVRNAGVTTPSVGDEPTHDRVIPEGIADDLGHHGGILPCRLSDLRCCLTLLDLERFGGAPRA